MKLSDVISSMPDASTLDALQALASKDPVLWSVLNRRVKDQPLIYDNSRLLAEDSLGEYRKTAIKSDYEDELHIRLLHHRPMLKKPLRDKHKHKVCEKARQVGVSELFLTEVLHFLATHPGTKVVLCVPEEAEILTRTGWKTGDKVTAGEEALVIDPETHVSRWEPILEVCSFDWDGPLEAVGPFHCTPDHRWPVERRKILANKSRTKRDMKQYGGERKVVRTYELKRHLHKIPRLAPHEHDNAPSILSPRLAAILGWVVTDGHRSMTGTPPNLNTPMMHVYQSRKKHLRKIEKLLRNEAKPAHTWTDDSTVEVGPKGGRIVGRFDDGKPKYGDCCYVRVLREDVDAITDAGYSSKEDLPSIVSRLSPEAARAMYEAMMDAEGCKSGRELKSRCFVQNDGPVLDAFQILCTLTGRYANITGTRKAKTAYVVEPNTQKAWLKPAGWDTQRRNYTGKVWCPRTPSGTWFMRYNGAVTFTGNTFPRDKQLTDFSVTRIAAVFAESPRMAALAGTPNQVFTKRIGDSYLILRSAWESNLGEGIDADMVVLDEKDRMRDKVELAFRESLKSSRHGLLREISTPTLPGRGIDIPFSASDQQVWMVKCEKCGDWQEVNWKENIIQVKEFPLGCKELPAESYEYLCRKQKCRGKLDRVNTGQWVARFPSRNHIRGYHISQLIAPWVSATRVMQDKIDFRFPEAWFNYVCGIPATGSLELLSDRDFENSCAGHELVLERDPKRWSVCSSGVDWGDYSWCVVLGRSAVNQRIYLLNIGVFEDRPDEEPEKMVENFIAPYSPEITIADAGYGKDRNSYLFKKLCPTRKEGRFFAQWYNPSQKASRTFQPEFSDPERARVLVDRTMQLKNVCRSVREREIGFADLGIDKVQLLMKHLKSLTPFREIDDETKQIVETIKNSGEDHLAHALASALLGMEKLSRVSKFDFSFL